MHEPLLGQLLGSVLHDLYSPLNAAQLYLHQYIMQPKPPRRWRSEDDRGTEALNSALRALNRTIRLCQDGNRLAALLCGQAVLLQPETCSLLGVLRSIDIEQPALLEKLDWSAFTHDLRLWADPFCLYRVLANLLSNARRYGGAQVRVAARVLDIEVAGSLPSCLLSRKSPLVALVIVSDDGVGIPAEQRELLFRPFSRLPGSAEPAGLGLGLWLSRELVRAHGGELWLSHEPETTFCSLWPLSAARPSVRLSSKALQPQRPLLMPPSIEIPSGTPLADAERLLFVDALRQCQGNRRAAADYLRIPRRTLYNKLRRHGL